MKKVKRAVVEITGISQLQFGRYHETQKLEKEQNDDYEERTWRNKAYFDEKGGIFIPPLMIRNCLQAAAKFLGMKIKGKGKSTYTKYFDSGIFVDKPMPINRSIEDVYRVAVFGNSKGLRGASSGGRVIKYFPTFLAGWTGQAEIIILDETITRDVLMEHLDCAGKQIGFGVGRPINGHTNGRFSVELIKWE